MSVLSVLFAPMCLSGQSGVALNGRVVDSTGKGVQAAVVVGALSPDTAALARGESDSAGQFHIRMSALPARVVIVVSTSSGSTTRLELDSAAIRGSSRSPIFIHMRAPHALAAVQIRARAQRRPSVFSFFEGEPSTRTETASPSSTEWLDPLSIGSVGALLRASPDFLMTAGGGASLLGAATASNQVQIGGVRVPDGVISGELGGTVYESPWDATRGGAAGATTNIDLGSAGAYRSTYATVRSGASGVPGWVDGARDAAGVTVPLQVSVGSSGPVGRLGYRANAFMGRQVTSLPEWTRQLGGGQLTVLDSISKVLGAPTDRTSERTVQSGVIGRLDFVPFSEKRVVSLTSALTHSSDMGGTRGGFETGSLGTTSTDDVGLLQFESTQVIGERVLWTSNASTSFTRESFTRASVAPTVIASDDAFGSILVTGGASPEPTSSIFDAQAKTSGTWYSVDNKTRYVAQLQARLEQAHLDPNGPHATFTASSLDAVRDGQATSLARASGTDDASASSLVIAPAISAHRDLGRNGSLVIGARADAWTTRGVLSDDNLQYVDISPRIGILRRLGTRSAHRGAIATLRVGAGRFTDWPSVRQWSDAWRDGGSLSVCTGTTIPAIDLTTDSATCTIGGTTQALGRTVAAAGLRPAVSNRVDASLAFASVAPGVRAEIGSAVSQNRRMLTTASPFAGTTVVDRLSDEGGRALLVTANSIDASGAVPVAAALGGAPLASHLVSNAASTAVQWRLRLATQDLFAATTWSVAYTLTTGTERSSVIASPTTSPGLVSGPLAAGGRHTIAFSLSQWIGDAQLRLAGMVRSGARFTPIADRDLNGDGLVNDAVFVPGSESASWANDVDRSMRSCIRAAAGKIVGVNSCTGPWSVTSLFLASVPAARFGLPRGSTFEVQLSNPLAALGQIRGVTFGSSTRINPTFLHVTGYDSVARQFRGVPLKGFGTPVGLAPGLGDPVRLAVSIRIPLGRSVSSQRANAAVREFATDTSSRDRQQTAMDFLSDIPPIPLVVLQAGAAIQLTADQRASLEALGARWQASAATIVIRAYGDSSGAGSGREARARLLAARTAFVVEASAMVAETRALLSPDQIELLPETVQGFLNPRLWWYLSLQDAGTF